MGNEASANAQTNVDKIAGLISELTVVEVCDLVKHLEEAYGVSAQAAVAPAAAAQGDGGEQKAAEEKSSFDVMLKAFKDKIPAIKAVRAITGLGLKEAKEMVEKSPVEVKANLDKAAAEDLKKQLEEAGCEVELK